MRPVVRRHSSTNIDFFCNCLQVYPQKIHLSDCEGQRKEVLLSLRPHLPVRGRPFKFEIQYNGSKTQPDNICIRGKKTDHEGCVTKLTKLHSVDRPLRLKIIAVCPRIKDEKRDDVEVKFQKPFYSKDNNIFWMGYDIPLIKVNISFLRYLICIRDIFHVLQTGQTSEGRIVVFH